MAATKKRNTLIAIIGAFVLLACAPQGEESVPRTSLTLDEVTVGELQEMMQAGDLSSVQLVDYYIDRIAQLDPQLNSILEINPDVHEIARALDAERLGGQIRSALHGIPVLLKDNIDTDGYRLGAGLEYAMSPNSFAKFEYRYSNYSEGEVDFDGDLPDSDRFDVDLDRHQIMAGVGVRF